MQELAMIVFDPDKHLHALPLIGNRGTLDFFGDICDPVQDNRIWIDFYVSRAWPAPTRSCYRVGYRFLL
jgi:hypothetical protein